MKLSDFFKPTPLTPEQLEDIRIKVAQELTPILRAEILREIKQDLIQEIKDSLVTPEFKQNLKEYQVINSDERKIWKAFLLYKDRGDFEFGIFYHYYTPVDKKEWVSNRFKSAKELYSFCKHHLDNKIIPEDFESIEHLCVQFQWEKKQKNSEKEVVESWVNGAK